MTNINTQPNLSGVGYVVDPKKTKPVYLVTLTSDKKGKNAQYFLAIDKPEPNNSFIFTKGIFVELEESEIIKKYSELLTNSPKEATLEVWFPIHRIVYVRNLVFRPVK